MPESEIINELRISPRDHYRRRYALSLLAALVAHATLLFVWRSGTFHAAEFGMQDEAGSIDVELVAGAESADDKISVSPPAEEAPVPEPLASTPPEPTPTPAEPAPEPVRQEEMPPPEIKPELVPAKPKPPQPDRPKAAQTARPAPSVKSSSRITGAATTGTSSSVSGRPGTGSGSGAGRGSSKPSYLSNPHPPYPPESKRNREQGVVYVRAGVGADGRVTSATLQRSSGFPRLDTAALEAVRRWRFRPATSAGVPVSDIVNVPVRFNLAD